MAVASENELVQLLADAQRKGSQATPIDPEKLAHIDLEAAYRVAIAQREALGEKSPMYKTAILKSGVGIAGQIFGSRIGHSPDYVFPSGYNIKGLEYEIGVELARDIGPEENLDEEALSKAVSSYFVGIEIVGTRLAPLPSGEKPPPATQLADHISALGYVIGAKCAKDVDVQGGLEVTLEVYGNEFHRKAGVHGFGSVLASAVAYAKSQHPGLPLKAGTLLTTGALSGCVPLPQGAKGLVVGRLGNEEPVRFTLQ